MADPYRQTARLPGYLWIGVCLMAGAQIGLLIDLKWVATWLTPIMWSGYILFIDGVLYKMQSRSWLTTRKSEFPLLALLSIAIWLVFEAYNFHMQNWLYRGVPEREWIRNFAYAWSFATILPGVFLTSELFQHLLSRIPWSRKRRIHLVFPDWLWLLVGASLLLIPLALPVPIARYVFGAVWLGFIFSVDPINRKLRTTSIIEQWEGGEYRLTFALLLGGLTCGFLWEAWNFQAYLLNGGHWVYRVPDALRIFDLHYGQMPLLGMLGFPPFAIELYILYHFLRTILGIDRFLGPLEW